VLELDHEIVFDPANEDAFFASLPAQSAVCLLRGNQERAEPYLIRTTDLKRRIERLLSPPDPTSKRLNLRDFACRLQYRVTGSAFEQILTYYQQCKQLFPRRYKVMTRLRPPAVLKVNLRNAYPRCYVTRRIQVDETGLPMAGVYYGPFPSRRFAEAFAERLLDMFKVRRCQIKIRRDPTFPGCIYSEMKMCLAPCFAGCTKEEYDTEVQRLVATLETCGESMRGAFEQERHEASDKLDFERAAAFHKKIEKLEEVLRGSPELARRIQDLHAVILQRTVEEQTVAVYTVRGGWLNGPFLLRFHEIATQPRSAEQILREYLEANEKQCSTSVSDAPEPVSSSDLEENLWLLARWYYSNPRVGEIFFRERDWPYRRILRACSRLLVREEGASEANRSTRTTDQKPGAS